MNVIGDIPAHTVFDFLDHRAVYEGCFATLYDELYAEYKDWCLDHDWKPVVPMWFGRYLREHAQKNGTPVSVSRIPPRTLCYVGVGLKKAEKGHH